VHLRATALCQPCAYLERLTASGVLESLRGRGGIRCEILREGILRIGDPVSCPALS
jgi:MOSC domain-containing protein YiiM